MTPREYSAQVRAFIAREKRGVERDKVFAYLTAALTGKAFSGALDTFEREFPDKSKDEQVKADTRLAVNLIKNMKIKNKTKTDA